MSLTLLGVSNPASTATTFYILMEDGFILLAESTDKLRQEDGIPSTVFAAWNPSDKSTNITLSGSNLVAQSTNAATDYQVRSTISKSSGSHYWETTFVRNTPTDPFFVIGGISRGTESVNAYTGFTDGCCVTTDGNTYKNGVFTSTGWGAWTDGQVAGFAWNATTGVLQVYRNNVLLGTIASGLSGTFFAGTGTFQTLGTSTTNFGATTMVYTAPVGYNQGLYN